ncbi:fumarylacetoacetate hydrolase family protein [bacterium]|nr:fumarylacetoacetate hydrolase family protein [bacterium]
MSYWIRFRHDGQAKFGTLEGKTISVFEGNMFEQPRKTTETAPLDNIEYLTPCLPAKMIGLVNNFYAAAEKGGLPIPKEPLYFFKPPSCFLPHTGEIVQPKSPVGRVIYEGELGIVIGKVCKDVDESEVEDCIFGYTCVNDVTALQMIHADLSFAQWCRAKSFDTFGVFGPGIRTDLDPDRLTVKSILNGRVRQDYPVADMIFSPRELVMRISRDMTLVPGDLIICGTSVGALPMKPDSTIEIQIDGIGTLTNTYVAAR